MDEQIVLLYRLGEITVREKDIEGFSRVVVLTLPEDREDNSEIELTFNNTKDFKKDYFYNATSFTFCIDTNLTLCESKPARQHSVVVAYPSEQYIPSLSVRQISAEKKIKLQDLFNEDMARKKDDFYHHIDPWEVQGEIVAEGPGLDDEEFDEDDEEDRDEDNNDEDEDGDQPEPVPV